MQDKTGHMPEDSDEFLDITDRVCPMTFVRTKLLLESMPAGARATIRLNSGEPLVNVPRSVQEMGHEILMLVPEDEKEPDGVHRLVIRKAENPRF